MVAASDSLTSVIIPAYNCEQTLATAVRSALNQEPPPREVIVVDDGSTDATQLMAHSFQGAVQFISQSHAGPAAARNRGVAIAHGKYIAFLDADDYWRPGFIAAGQGFLEAHAEAIAVSVGVRFIGADGKERGLEAFEAGPGNPNGTSFLIEDFFSFWGAHDHIRTGSCLFRKDILEMAGGQRENLRITEDLEFWAYLATYGKWGCHPRVLWVCDSERASVQAGWLNKYHERRKVCPTVADWQERILPRLHPKDMPGFLRARGRVAALLAHTLVLAGHRLKARKEIRKYGSEMPPTWSALLMRAGDKSGWLGWHFVCALIQGRELQKAVLKAMFKNRCSQC